MRNRLLFLFTLAVMAYVHAVISHNTHKSLNMTQLKQKYDQNRKDKQYYLEADAHLSWLDAHQYCKLHGMELASVDNKADQAKLESVLKKNNVPDQYLWLSGMRMRESVFYLRSKGRIVIFKNWESDFPAGSACGNWCVLTSLHIWKDNDCMDKYGFVCEYYEE